MIDTIKLVLNSNMYTIIDRSKFFNGVTNTTRGVYTLVQNPTKTELLSGNYKPRLTLTNRFREETVTVELSLPKLLKGNNFDELQNSDFEIVVDRLQTILKQMGVLVFTKILTIAPVSSVHYSKNIPLTDGSIPYYYLKKIYEANVSKSLDVNQTDFLNEGHGVKWHTNSYEVTFYDKLKDLESAKKSDKRAIESDNAIQLSLFDSLKAKNRFEVLRMEVRLNTRRIIRKTLKGVGFDLEPTFESVFNSEISKRILLCYLHEIESKRPILLDYQDNKPKELLADLIINNPKLGMKRTLLLFGLKQALEKVGMREMRVMFGNYTDRTWYRLVDETNKIRLPIAKDVFGIIREHLTTFEPLKLVDFQDEMLNNDKYN